MYTLLYTLSFLIVNLVGFVVWGIPNKDSSITSWVEFTKIILTIIKHKIFTDKRFEVTQLGLLFGHELIWILIKNGPNKTSIDHIIGYINCFWPEVLCYSCINQYSPSNIYQGSIFPLHNTILVRCSRSWKVVIHYMIITKLTVLCIFKFCSMIWPNPSNLFIVFHLYLLCKSFKHWGGFLLRSQKHFSDEPWIIINYNKNILLSPFTCNLDRSTQVYVKKLSRFRSTHLFLWLEAGPSVFFLHTGITHFRTEKIQLWHSLN